MKSVFFAKKVYFAKAYPANVLKNKPKIVVNTATIIEFKIHLEKLVSVKRSI